MREREKKEEGDEPLIFVFGLEGNEMEINMDILWIVWIKV